MPDQERIARGLEFEERVAAQLGASTIGGSGSSWRSKSDVRGKLRVSCKAEATKSWNRIREHLAEAITFAFSTGEHPALGVLDDDNQAFVVMRLEDFSSLLADGITIQPVRTRGDLVRQNADTPSLLREA
jgi:hypothetical protein